MNILQMTVTIIDFKSSENEDGLSVYSGIGQFDWLTGKEEPGIGKMSFYACGVSGFVPVVGEKYVLNGQARIKKTPLEGGGKNTTLHLLVKGVSLPLTPSPKSKPEQELLPTPEPLATQKEQTTKTKTATKTPAKSKQLATVGADDIDNIPF